MSDLETKLREFFCPCSTSYYNVEFGYKVCRTAKNDCKVFKMMKVISESGSPKETAHQFIKEYKFT